jgi:hypothetical protein
MSIGYLYLKHIYRHYNKTGNVLLRGWKAICLKVKVMEKYWYRGADFSAVLTHSSLTVTARTFRRLKNAITKKKRH